MSKKNSARNRNRANGEGWITKRKDGRGYDVGLHTEHPDGTVERKATTKKKRSDAATWLERQLSQRGQGLALSKDNPTIREYAEEWIENSVRGSVKPPTYKQYKGVVKNHIVPNLGGIRIKSLTSRRIQKLYADEYDASLAVGTRRHTHTVLKRMLNQAVQWGDIAHNPAAFVKPPKAKVEGSSERGEDIKPYSEDELRQIFEATRDNRLAALYKFAPATGLREQELLALTWSDLKLRQRSRGEVRVKNAVVETESGFEIGATKNRKSRRTVEFPQSVVAVMLEHRDRQLEESVKPAKWRSRPWEDNGFVFPNAYGMLLNRHRLQRYFANVRQDSGVGKHHQFKDFRHTFATLMFSRKIHPKVVQHMMGHSSVKITMDIYSHWITGAHDDAGDVLNDLF